MKDKLAIVLVVLASVLFGWSLLSVGLPPTHDGEYHVIRAYQFDKTLRDGDFYPRWLPDLNYGYGIPLLNYYYPLPYYVMSFFHYFGISFIDGFKFGMLVATLIGAFFFFLWARIFWGKVSGFVCAVFYTFSPYHIVDVYIRGSVGEVWALAFFPGFLWSVTKFVKDGSLLFMPISAIFLSLIIFSHNILALMFFPFAISYTIFIIYIYSKNKLFTTYCLLFTIFLALGLSAIFWIPAIFERGYVTGLQIYNVKEHFPEFYQLIFPSWGSGFSASNIGSQMSFQIGVANLLAVVGSIVMLFGLRKKLDKQRGIIIFFLTWFFITLFLMLKISLPLWEKISFLNYFQFPWRFLSLMILYAAFLAGSFIYFLRLKIFAIIATLVAVLLTVGYITPAYYLDRDDNYYITRPNFIDGTNTPGNIFNTIWINRQLNKRRQEKFEIVQGEAKISVISIKSTKYTITLSAKDDTIMQINTAYFPGWQAFVDGDKIEAQLNKDGLIQFLVPKGNHRVDVRFLDTPIRTQAKIITILSFITVLFLFNKGLRVRMKNT